MTNPEEYYKVLIESSDIDEIYNHIMEGDNASLEVKVSKMLKKANRNISCKCGNILKILRDLIRSLTIVKKPTQEYLK